MAWKPTSARMVLLGTRITPGELREVCIKSHPTEMGTDSQGNLLATVANDFKMMAFTCGKCFAKIHAYPARCPPTILNSEKEDRIWNWKLALPPSGDNLAYCHSYERIFALPRDFNQERVPTNFVISNWASASLPKA